MSAAIPFLPPAMSKESHQRFLERTARRAVERKRLKDAQRRPTQDAVAKIRIQTVEPWKRISCMLIGTGFLFVSWLIQQNDGNLYAVLFLGFLGTLGLIIGLFGKKRTIESILNATGDSIISNLLDGL